MRNLARSFVVLVALLVLSANAFAGSFISVGDSVRYQLIGAMDVDRLNEILTTDMQKFTTTKKDTILQPATNGVTLYRVIYRTVIPEQGNAPVEASGLIAVPDVKKSMYPLLSYQHGTVFSKEEVPSFPDKSMETLLMVAEFAGNGYVVIAPDYIGKGLSPAPDSYMVRESTKQACMDMLLASRAVLDSLHILTGEFFLSGWSQGAWSTMQFRRKLEELNIPVTAAATASTPSDLYVMLTRWINNPSPLDATWLPGAVVLFLNAYERYYGLDALTKVAIKPAYWETAVGFYENKLNWEQASAVLPKTVGELLTEEFAKASSTVDNHFYRQFFENQAYRWRYATPSRYYYGKIDEVMPPYVAAMPVEYQQAVGGAEATAVYAGDDADHRGAFIFGIRDQREWFDSLTGK